ncbi:MAG: class I SAM-dependent methyltransferase [Actinomycetota bacterium]
MADESGTKKTSAATGQVTATAAEIYESFFVPALFDQWPTRLLDAANPSRDDRILDVGCGTGILARTAAERLAAGVSAAPDDAVHGLDPNEGMLAVAAQSGAAVTWDHGTAEALPYPDDSFDHVLSQFALMFFTDQVGALSEMRRVLRPEGSLTVATWAGLDHTPGYGAMIELLDRLFGQDAADALRAPFTLGAEADLRPLLTRSFPDATITMVDGTARFASIEAWVHTDVRGWTLADMIDDDQYRELLDAATVELGRFVDEDGQVRFAAPALIVTAGGTP